jgi:hypothetical protein
LTGSDFGAGFSSISRLSRFFQKAADVVGLPVHFFVMGSKNEPLKNTNYDQESRENSEQRIGPVEIRFRHVYIYNNRLRGRYLRVWGTLLLHILSYWFGGLLIDIGWTRLGYSLPAITGGIFVCFLALFCLTACEWSLGWWL